MQNLSWTIKSFWKTIKSLWSQKIVGKGKIDFTETGELMKMDNGSRNCRDSK